METTTQNFTEFEEFRGTFENGWTDEDINLALPELEEILGVSLVCVWDRYDEVGFAGDSNLYVMDAVGIGNVYELSGEWLSFLISGEGSPDVANVSNNHSPISLRRIGRMQNNGRNLAILDAS